MAFFGGNLIGCQFMRMGGMSMMGHMNRWHYIRPPDLTPILVHIPTCKMFDQRVNEDAGFKI